MVAAALLARFQCHPCGCCVVCPGPAEGGGPAQAEAVRYSSRPAAVHQLPESGPFTLTDLETDEATHAGRTGSEDSETECVDGMRCLQLCRIIVLKIGFWLEVGLLV